MKKSSMVAAAALAAALPVWAEEVNTVQPLEAEKDTSLGVELSLRLGAIGERNSSDPDNTKFSNWFKTGAALQLEARGALGDSGFDLVARGYYGRCDVDKDEANGWGYLYSNYRGSGYDIYDLYIVDDGDVSIFGGSLQLQYNFARDAEINPYLAAGVAYEKSDFDLTIGEYLGLTRHGSTTFLDAVKADQFKLKTNEDGTAFVGRVGTEFNLAPFRLVAEVSYLSKLYDYEDKGQFEVSGRAGFQWTKSCRIDAGIDYYTEWEQFFAGVGLTLCL